MKIDDALFAETLRENVRRRSRSASGQDGNTVSGSDKRKMLLSGDALAAKVAENVEALIVHVLDMASKPWFHESQVRFLCERGFDIATDGLIDWPEYEDGFRRVEADSALLRADSGMDFGFNRRYRLWTPQYRTVADIPPQLIGHFMRLFYEKVACEVRTCHECGEETGRIVRLMAYADVMMDGVIHPWLDACSRVSLALVMWIALRLDGPLPLYHPDKKVHVSTLTDLAAHADYFRKCVRRWEKWAVDR